VLFFAGALFLISASRSGVPAVTRAVGGDVAAVDPFASLGTYFMPEAITLRLLVSRLAAAENRKRAAVGARLRAHARSACV